MTGRGGLTPSPVERACPERSRRDGKGRADALPGRNDGKGRADARPGRKDGRGLGIGGRAPGSGFKNFYLFLYFFLDNPISVSYIGSVNARNAPGAPRGRLSRPIPPADPRAGDASRRAERGFPLLGFLCETRTSEKMRRHGFPGIPLPLTPSPKGRGAKRPYSVRFSRFRLAVPAEPPPLPPGGGGSGERVWGRGLGGGGFWRRSFRRGSLGGGRSGEFLAKRDALRPGREHGPTRCFSGLFFENEQRKDVQNDEDHYPMFADFAAGPAWRSGSPTAPKALRGKALPGMPERCGGPVRRFFSKDRPVCPGQETGTTSCFSCLFPESNIERSYKNAGFLFFISCFRGGVAVAGPAQPQRKSGSGARPP